MVYKKLFELSRALLDFRRGAGSWDQKYYEGQLALAWGNASQIALDNITFYEQTGKGLASTNYTLGYVVSKYTSVFKQVSSVPATAGAITDDLLHNSFRALLPSMHTTFGLYGRRI